MSASPGPLGRGTPVPAARIERTSPARNRPNSTARPMAATSASLPWAASRSHSSTRSPARVVTPRAAAPLMNASATGPRAQNATSAGVLALTARVGSGLGPP